MKKCSYCGAEYPDDMLTCPVDQSTLPPTALSATKKHSGLGIASFALSIVVGGLIFIVFCAATVLSSHRTPGARAYPGQTIVGLFIILFTAADAVAAGLGIAALFQKEKNRLFGILGVAFSSATIVGVVGLIIIGLMYIRSTGR